MRLALLLVALSAAPAAAQTCTGARGCNPPGVYSNGTVTTTGNAPVYIQSSNWDSVAGADLTASIKTGVTLAASYLGYASGTRIYLLAPGGSTSDYSSMQTDICTYFDPTGSNSACFDSDISSAIAGGGQYYVSGGTSCICSYTQTSTPMVIAPTTSDVSSPGGIMEIMVHEYTHAFQAAAGGPMPEWLREGGAVYMACMMASKTSASGYAGAPSYSTFQGCMQSGGGSSGVIANLRTLYTSDSSKTWLTTYGEDRTCGTAYPSSIYQTAPLTSDQERQVYYDVGAMAVAFAIYKGNQRDSSLTSTDFWRSVTDGFWHKITPYQVNYETGWAASVPEGYGWKAALCNYTGHASMAAFYSEFEGIVVASGSVASVSTLLGYLETDSSVAAQVNVNATSASANFPLGPKTATCSSTTSTSGAARGGPTASVWAVAFLSGAISLARAVGAYG